MKRILLPFSSHTLTSSLIDFGCYMARLSQSTLTGICINTDHLTADPASYSHSYFTESDAGMLLEKAPVKMDSEQCIHFFIEACERREVKADVLLRGNGFIKHGTPAKEVIQESRFADLLIVDPAMSFHDQLEAVPTAFAKELLAAAECPVMVAPAVFDDVDELVFCYDGHRSSVYAIKQFSYLFPEMNQRKVTVLQIGENEQPVSEKEALHNWLGNYYHEIVFKQLVGDAGDELLQYFLLRKNMLAVMGAYGRSLISTFFKKSSADMVLRVVDLPLFIAHNK
jgi:hypothetical protein